MKTVVTEKPMYFKCDCGGQFLVGTWNYQSQNELMAVRFFNDCNQFGYCPMCGSKMNSKEMRVEHGPF